MASQGFWHVRRRAYRLLMLFLMCVLTFGSYYCYDIPGALKGAFFRHFDGLTQLQYSLLYSLYSWPNTVQVFFGGYVMDRYLGIRYGCVVCCILIFAGQLLVTIGVLYRDLHIVLAGRFVFGMGGETLIVGQSAFATKWFKGSDLASALGLCLALSRLGSAATFDISPAVMNARTAAGADDGFEWALFTGLGFCGLSLTISILLGLLDQHADAVKAAESPVKRGCSRASSRAPSVDSSLHGVKSPPLLSLPPPASQQHLSGPISASLRIADNGLSSKGSESQVAHSRGALAHSLPIRIPSWSHQVTERWKRELSRSQSPSLAVDAVEVGDVVLSHSLSSAPSDWPASVMQGRAPPRDKWSDGVCPQLLAERLLDSVLGPAESTRPWSSRTLASATEIPGGSAAAGEEWEDCAAVLDHGDATDACAPGSQPSHPSSRGGGCPAETALPRALATGPCCKEEEAAACGVGTEVARDVTPSGDQDIKDLSDGGSEVEVTGLGAVWHFGASVTPSRTATPDLNS